MQPSLYKKYLQSLFCISNLLVKGHVFDRLVYVHGRLETVWDHRKL